MTPLQAHDEIVGMLVDADVPDEIQMIYEGVVSDRLDDNKPFCRLFIRHSGGGQRTLGGRGHRAFERMGFANFYVYAPTAKGLPESLRLAKVIADVYEGNHSPGGIWFRNVVITEVGKDGMFMQVNVTVNFEYHETK